MSSIEWTRVLLGRWGRWAKGRVDLGLPKSAAFVHAKSGDRGAATSDYVPPDVQQVDTIIANMKPIMRQPLVVFYATGGSVRQRALNANIPRSTLMKRLKKSESFVRAQLEVQA